MTDGYLSRICRIFESILQEYIPYLYRKFKDIGIYSEIYLVEWLFSLFSRGLSPETTLKFWDHLLYHEELAIFRMSLGVL